MCSGAPQFSSLASFSFCFYADAAMVSSILISSFSFFFFYFLFGFVRDLVCLSMFSSSEVRTECPSISFLFARLGGFLGVFLYLENFISEGNSLGVVVADLLPLFRQSIDWFRDLVREAISEVRSSELEIGLSLSSEPVEGDTAVSASREVRDFYALNRGVWFGRRYPQ